MMVSPDLTLSPTLTVHSTIFPSVMVDDSAGINTSMASAIDTAPAWVMGSIDGLERALIQLRK